MNRKSQVFVLALFALLIVPAVSAEVIPTKPPMTKSSTMPSTLEDVIAAAPFPIPADVIKHMKDISNSTSLAQNGDAEASKGNWIQAVSSYQAALVLWPTNQIASYGMGDYCLAQNDLQGAVRYYRQVIYAYPDPPPSLHVVFAENNNAYRVMEYALLLSETGQQDEALTVYRHGAQILNYMNGRPHLKLMLPDFGDGPGQIAFTPERLQALAQVGWAVDHVDFDTKGAWARLQEAAGLFPDSPVPYFYRARHELRYRQDSKAARTDFDKAAQIGSAADANAVQEMRHIFRGQLGEDTPTVQKPQVTP